MAKQNDNEPSWRVLARAFKALGGIKVVSFDLNLSFPLVRKWQAEPPSADCPEGSGARNPLDRVNEIRKSADAAGVPEAGAAVIRWLATQAGYRLVRMAALPKTADGVLLETVAAAKEGGDVSGVVKDALEDGRITMAEAQTIHKEIGEAIEQLRRLGMAVDKVKE